MTLPAISADASLFQHPNVSLQFYPMFFGSLDLIDGDIIIQDIMSNII